MKIYTIKDIKYVECMLEPIKCVHCNHVGEVTYMQYVGDGHCANCGEWQEEE